MSGITSSTALWYASRATGIIALIMLTGVVVLGVAVQKRGTLPGLPRFATVGLHRSISLLAVVFLVIHVLSAVGDSYVSISITAAFVPFVSSYEPLWLGLGAVSLDLIVALIVTSLLRARIGRRTWRAVHWLAYVSWPVAVAHSLGSSPDMQTGWLLGLGIACILAVIAALAWRFTATPDSIPRAARVSALFTQLRRGQTIESRQQ